MEVWVEIFKNYNECRAVLVTEFGEYTIYREPWSYGVNNVTTEAKKFAKTLGLDFVIVCDMQDLSGTGCHKEYISSSMLKKQSINP